MKNIKNMDIVSQNPNLTIVLPTQCKADCSFCSWRTSKQDKQTFDDKLFLESLKDTLTLLPPGFTQITISGGEPSTYSELESVMTLINQAKNIEKVVFTTNGENLLYLSKQKWFTNVVNYVNISRHHWDSGYNQSIFKLDMIDWKTIKKVSKNLALEAIPTNINCVLSNSINEMYKVDFIKNFVKVCKANNINSITFRNDYDDGDNIHYIESSMGKALSDNSCPVCRKAQYLVSGMNVFFTNSVFEPMDILGDNVVYEFILQPNGDLTIDWNGNYRVTLIEPDYVSASKPDTKVFDTPPGDVLFPGIKETREKAIKNIKETTMSYTEERVLRRDHRIDNKTMRIGCGTGATTFMRC